MAKDVIGPIGALKEGCGLLRRYPIVILASVSLATILIVCAKLPLPDLGVSYPLAGDMGILNWLLLLVVWPLLGGMHVLLLNAARGTNPRLADLFSGIPHFAKWFSAGWAVAGAFGVFLLSCFLLMVVAAALYAHSSFRPEGVDAWMFQRGLIAWAPTLAPILASALFAQYVFALFAVADEAGVNSSVERSQALVGGRQLRLLPTLLATVMLPGGLLIVRRVVWLTNANAFGLPGWVAYWFGLAGAVLVAMCVVAATYVRLDRLTPSRTSTPA